MNILATLILSLSLAMPHSAFAFLGMNAGASLQGPLPAWTKQLGFRTVKVDTYNKGVATDSSGNIFVVGYTAGGLDGNTLTGWQDAYVTKYDSTGAKIWTKQLGVASHNTSGNAVATDSSGNVFVAGSTDGGLDGNTLTGSQDFFVTKYNSSGTKLWTKQLGAASSWTYGNGVATDSSGNVFVAGYTDSGLDGNTLTGNRDFYVTKYNSTGTKLWTRQLGKASAFVSGDAVATDPSGNVFVSGDTTDGLDGNSLIGSWDGFVTKYDSTGTKIWTKELGTASGQTFGYAVTTDSSGNIIVSGYTTGGLDGNSLTGMFDFFVTKYDSTGAKLWTKQLGVASEGTEANAVTADSSGNIFVAGDTRGGLDGNSLTGWQDTFITKYSSTGTKLWTKLLGAASQSTIGHGLATNSSGNVFLAGDTGGGIDGNTMTGTRDFFLTQYDSAGSKTWTKQLGATGPSSLNTAAATSDSSGNLYIAGTTDSDTDGNTLTGTTDFFVTKYDSTGTKLWTRQLGVDSQNTLGQAVATDASGNVFVAGYTTGGLDGNTLTGYQDFFVTKYDSSGTKLWTKQLGAASIYVYGYGVATDSSGNVFVGGITSGGLDGNSLIGNQDIFVTKYDSTGTKLWTKELGVASKSTYGQAVATDSSGNVFIAGYTKGGLDGNTLTGTQDFFVTKYNSSGTKLWTKQLGVASKATYGYGVATDSTGNIFVAGHTKGGLDGNTLKGTQDFFVTKYDSTGTKLWTKQLGATSKATYGYAVTTDPSGNVFVAGETTGALDGNSLKGTNDFYVSKFTSTGLKQWTKQMGSPSSVTRALGITMHASGRLYVTGTTTGGLDFSTQTGAIDAFSCQYIGN